MITHDGTPCSSRRQKGRKMSRRTSILAIGGALGCLSVFLCIAVAVLAGFVYYTNASALRSVDRIAFVDNDQNIQIVDARGENHVTITSDAASSQRAYLFPTFSPNGQRLAFIEVTGGQADHSAAVRIAPTAGGNLTTAFESNSQIPFYLYWAPDSQRVGFLAQGENQLILMLAGADGKEEARELETGSPLYWSWSPDTKSLFLHVGGSSGDNQAAHLELLQWQGTGEAQKLPDAPAQFQAPHFSPDGSAILYAKTNSSGEDELFIADARGNDPQSIKRFSGSIAFAWSPDGKRVASIVTPENAELPVYGSLSVSDAKGQNEQALTSQQVLAFYWAPNSKQIAFLTFADSQNSGSSCSDCPNAPDLVRATTQESVRLRWQLADVESGQVITLVTFTPTDDFITLLPFFDQFARSITFWSPDSKHFVYAQAEGDSGGSVWVADLDAGTGPRKVGEGTLAVWSWK